MHRTASLALSALHLASLPAQTGAEPLERLSAAEPFDIVSAALRGSEDDINTVLARSSRIFVMKIRNGATIDARDVAVFYALFCDRPEAARLMLKRGVGLRYDELIFMPPMEASCKKEPSTESARREIIEAEKALLVGGDAIGERPGRIVFAGLSPGSLDVILEFERDYCKAKSSTGQPLRQHLEGRKDAMACLKVYEARCQ